MKSLNWPDIIKASQKSPELRMKDYISMSGALDILISDGKQLPEKLYAMTSDIEAKLRNSFPQLTFIAEENVNEFNPKYSGTRYLGHIYGIDATDTIISMRLSGIETAPRLDNLLTFSAIFPLGDYKKQSEEALKGIWQYIKGFEYLMPQIMTARTPRDKHGNQSISLVQDGAHVATGEYAIAELGFSFKLKEPIHIYNSTRV